MTAGPVAYSSNNFTTKAPPWNERGGGGSVLKLFMNHNTLRCGVLQPYICECGQGAQVADAHQAEDKLLPSLNQDVGVLI